MEIRHCFPVTIRAAAADITVVKSPSQIGNRGTAQSSYNKNDSSTRTSDAVFRIGAVFAAGSGTTMPNFHLPSATGPFGGGASSDERDEIIFTTGTTYGIQASFTGKGSIAATWYETTL